MERLSATAAALLQLESPAAPLHAGWVARLEPRGRDAFDLSALLERVTARLTRAPRLRQVPAPNGSELVWRASERLELAEHVAVWPGTEAGEEALRRALDAFLGEPLARDRPLWRLLVVPHTRAGGAVIAGKLHRALAGAGDADRLRALVFDAAPAPGDALALDEFRAHRRQLRAGGHGDAGRIGTTLRRVALARTVGRLTPAPPSFLDGAGGRRRAFVTARAETGRIGRIAAHAGATPHEVVLALAAGTLRRLALAGDAEPRDVRALVPLDVGEDELLGEAPCAVLELPVGERRPARRLAAVRAGMDAALRATRDGTSAGGAPAVIAGPPGELASRLALSARVCNVTIPSGAAPPGSLHVGGVRVRALFAIPSVPEDHALGLSTLSYARHLHVSAAADPEAVRAVRRLPVMLADAVEELGLASGALR